MRRLPVFAAVILVTLSGCAGSIPFTDSGPPDTIVPEGDAHADIPPVPADLSDPAEDRLGWEGGYWYNESIDVDQSDGLDDEELAAVTNRSMARVEYIRGLEFERSVPVDVVARDEFSQARGNRTTSANRTRFDNVKFEALFMINESTNSMAVQSQNRGASVGGYYAPERQRIVIVSENADSPRLSEVTLSQELFHALQDQQFDITSYNQSTREDHNAIDGIVEGDGNLVDYLYEQRCESEWSCLTDESSSDSGENGESASSPESGLADIGPYLLKYQPYSDGPAFVYAQYQVGGWDAVNAVYDNPPASTSQVIHPEQYPDDAPAEPTVSDRTSGSWERIAVDGRVNYAEVGEAGLAAMLAAPLYEKPGAQIVPPREWLNTNESGDPRQFDPLSYDTSYTDGFEGDRLIPYANDANETGYVWRIQFENESSANEFRDGYEQLLDYRNASEVEDASGPGTVYRIPDDDPNGFGDSFRVVQRGDTIVVTNAPTVDALSKVHAISDS
ncbi:Hvo_1808 family surface protein [Halogranum rubrum]|uniref:Lipoprotein n=1 Tax=Halogranum salarium B-1 TaxID=1210908 RepID=J2ZZB9_9EURY|nr:Hvo_1808 family surface protein [Halogranum salarium]EJN58383.1 hypothetical protein HSB1_38000 [Halogranum salarium B-1]